MTKVYALYRITTGDVENEMIATGFDDLGRPIVKRSQLSHLPGDIFEMRDPIELRRLLEMRAIRHLTQEELDLIEAAQARAAEAAKAGEAAL